MKNRINYIFFSMLLLMIGCDNAEQVQSGAANTVSQRSNKAKSPDPSKIANDPTRIENGILNLNFRYWEIPISIMVPAHGEIGAVGTGVNAIVFYEFEKSGRNYNIGIEMTALNSDLTMEQLLEEQKDMIKGQWFDKIIKEEANGFIYKMNIEGRTDYSFHYFHKKGNRAIGFVGGLNPPKSEYSQKEIEYLYQIAKEAK